MTVHRSSGSSAALIPALLLFGGMTLLLVLLFGARPSQTQVAAVPTQTAAATIAAAVEATAEAVTPLETTAEATPVTPLETTAEADGGAQTVAYSPAQISAGEMVYQSTCSACHGFNARGIQGLGKTLIGSEFVNSLTDEEFLTFLHVGRDITDPLNTTGIPMPPRGGNPAMTDADLMNVIAYVRSLNPPAQAGGDQVTALDPTATPVTPLETTPAATPTPWQPLVAQASTPVFVPANPVLLDVTRFGSPGEAYYVQACAGCHGLDGAGVDTIQNSSLVGNELIASRNGFGLENFLIGEHPPINPEAGFPHPYRGGYPELSDQQIRDIVAYLYTLPLAQ